MASDCIGCNPTHESGHLCNSCKDALKTGRIFKRLIIGHGCAIGATPENGMLGQKIIVQFPDQSGASGDTLIEAAELAGIRLEE